MGSRLARLVTLGAPLAGGGAPTFDSLMLAYVAAGQLPLWYSFRETSGVAATNRGSLGAAMNGTSQNFEAGELGQAGLLADPSAYAWDGDSTTVGVPSSAAHSGLTQITKMILCKPSGTGEGSNGFFMQHLATGFENFFDNSLSAITARLRNDVDSLFLTAATTGQTVDTWSIIFATYDDAGDRKVRLYLGNVSGFSELAYSAQPALTGTFKTIAATLDIGNTSSINRTYQGLIDEAAVFNVALSETQMEAIYNLIPFV